MPPRLHAAVIQRGDLLARLDAGLTRKITLVTAPTGYGKTTLISFLDCRSQNPIRLAYPGEYDNDPVRFWTYVRIRLTHV